MVTISPEALGDPDAQALIARLNAELTELYPDPNDRHFGLTEEQVSGDNGVFLLARRDGVPVGCGALRRIAPTTGEIKRMYVSPAARGAKVGRRLLEELERQAHALSITRVVLETGPHQKEALGLYDSAGYRPIPAWGEYVNSPLSICLGKDLT
ncbi:MAG TPA: GNAT family N-acetyltransferase [Thermomonospora sp.]|nr:GNAT family N-acetyltransferase [Thermomonospora sp.]